LSDLKTMKFADEQENGGRKGIRTLVTLSRKHAFQACAFNHSATLPQLFQVGAPKCAPGTGAAYRSNVIAAS
jgi:hypothetical protein